MQLHVEVNMHSQTENVKSKQFVTLVATSLLLSRAT